MDVYIGCGLLSAGLVVLIFMIFDSWFKNRNTKVAELSGLHDQIIDDPEFIVSVSRPDDQNSFIESNTDYSDSIKVIKEEDKLEVQFDPEPNKNMNQKVISSQKNNSIPSNLLILSVMAQNENRFESYDLLQAISAAGLQFGEMNIFHFYQMTSHGKVSLFSLASANKPGDFDLNNIAEISCRGLMLFVNMSAVPDPHYAFKLMLEAAERLAEDLEGVLCADPMTPWNEKIAWRYTQKIMQYKLAPKNEEKLFA